MGRIQAFDTDQVVRAARTVFWELGYERASLPELERATGLNRSSIYHAFTNKRGLFDSVVQSYLDEIIRPRLRILTADPVSPGAVVVYLSGLRDALAARGSLVDNGCLLINAAGSPISNDVQVGAVIANYRTELESALHAGVVAHLPDGSPTQGRQLATLLTSLVITAMTLARIDNAQSVNSIDTALQLVESARDAQHPLTVPA